MDLSILTCAVLFTSKTVESWNKGTAALFQRYAHLTQFPDKSSGTPQFSHAGWAPVPRHTSPDNICFLISMVKLSTKRWNDDLVVNFGRACFAEKFDVLVQGPRRGRGW